MKPPSLAHRLRSLPALTGDLPKADPLSFPEDPVDAFIDWLGVAIDSGVPEPHAMGVSTVDVNGTPTSRVVLLTDVRDGCWWFATDGRSVKARDLEADPRCALSFYWQPLGRQVRLTGVARQADPAQRDADFLTRSPSSRAAMLASKAGQTLVMPQEVTRELRRARERVDREPGLVAPHWQVWLVEPVEMEFWQGVSDRAHLRMVYQRHDLSWSRRLVSP